MLEAFELIIIHYIADFIFQDEKWANNKSKSIKALLNHTITYSVVFGILTFLIPNLEFNNIWSWGAFVYFVFIGHTLVDFITSKIVSKKFANKQYGSKIPNFGAFSIIGIDQVIHYGMLFFTYNLFKLP